MSRPQIEALTEQRKEVIQRMAMYRSRVSTCMEMAADLRICFKAAKQDGHIDPKEQDDIDRLIGTLYRALEDLDIRQELTHQIDRIPDLAGVPNIPLRRRIRELVELQKESVTEDANFSNAA